MIKIEFSRNQVRATAISFTFLIIPLVIYYDNTSNDKIRFVIILTLSFLTIILVFLNLLEKKTPE